MFGARCAARNTVGVSPPWQGGRGNRGKKDAQQNADRYRRFPLPDPGGQPDGQSTGWWAVTLGFIAVRFDLA